MTITKVSEEWLSTVVEPAIDPEIEIIDAHHHIWPPSFQDHIAAYGKSSPDDFTREIERSGHNVIGSVHVTINTAYRQDLPDHLKPVAETEYLEREAEALLEREARRPGIIAAVVGSVDMQLGDRIGEVLDAHVAASPKRFRGIRDELAWHPSDKIAFRVARDGLMLTPAFKAAAKALASRDQSLDAWVYYNQIPQIVTLAKAVPGLRIVLNHVGTPVHGPAIGEAAAAGQEEWRSSLSALAKCENIYVKLGGLAMAMAVGDMWSRRNSPPTSAELADQQRSAILHAIDVFGPRRAMLESNFPADKCSASYGVIWNALKRVVGDFTDEEKSLLFRKTAQEFYRI